MLHIARLDVVRKAKIGDPFIHPFKGGFTHEMDENMTDGGCVCGDSGADGSGTDVKVRA